jgi:uncharacterized Zn finger protein (UPF0148 family)
MKCCTNCGIQLDKGVIFCPNCGKRIKNNDLQKSHFEPETEENTLIQINNFNPSDIAKINKKISLKNSQTSIVKGAWYSAGFFLLIIVLAFIDLGVVNIHPAIVMISIFFLLMSLVVAYMFRSREKKLQSLITGENLLASWTLKEAYENYLFEHEKSKNSAIFLVITMMGIIVFGIFILVIDEGKLAMFSVLIGLLVFLSFFAFGMPRYYKYQNSKNDGIVLIGAKFAYINGYFHNWDFILSGLSKLKKIKSPFYGINLVYYYTDRTLTNSEELFIPANNNVDLDELVRILKEKNASTN